MIKNGYNDPSKYTCWKLFWATLIAEIKPTPLILQTAKEGCNWTSFSLPETKDGEFLLSVFIYWLLECISLPQIGINRARHKRGAKYSEASLSKRMLRASLKRWPHNASLLKHRQNRKITQRFWKVLRPWQKCHTGKLSENVYLSWKIYKLDLNENAVTELLKSFLGTESLTVQVNPLKPWMNQSTE